MPDRVDAFSDEYRFLSNYSPAEVVLDRQVYPTVEHAYQAAKTRDRAERLMIQKAPSPGNAKKQGQKITLRAGWNNAMRLAVMEQLLRQKFAHPTLREQLLATGDAELIEGNTWGDRFWGVCGETGENHLGRLLMKIRDELRR